MKKVLITILLLSAISIQAKTLSCGGTEPFWGARIDTDNGNVSISSPLDLKVKHYKTEIIAASGTSVDYAFVAYSKKLTIAVVENSTCSDGMSEENYTHSIILKGKNYGVLVGCCK